MVMSDVFRMANGQWVYMDTRNTFDAGWETMVFPCDSQGNVTNWKEIFVERYLDEATATARHEQIKHYLITGQDN